MASQISLADALQGIRFAAGLPRFLRRTIRPDDARDGLERRFSGREATFLGWLRGAIFGQNDGPYRRLLTAAGCEPGDVERLVATEGVEGALQALFSQGVYFTVDEARGRRPVVRGSTHFSMDLTDLRGTDSGGRVAIRSSGSRTSGTAVEIPFDSLREMSEDCLLGWQARAVPRARHAVWAVPGSGTMGTVLFLAATMGRVHRWFSPIDPDAETLHPRYRWSMRAMSWGGLLSGAPIPLPEYVSMEEPLAIAHWLREAIREVGAAHLWTSASAGVRLGRAAARAGLDLRGAHLTVGGEPVTEARMRVIRASGMEATPRYASSECGFLGLGCVASAEPDEVHFAHDLHALIQPGPAMATELPPRALLISSFRPKARLTLLNYALGDQAVVDERQCGCPLDALGWTTHLHTIRSYEKLTSGGMTFLGTDIIAVLEEVLPARFGGAPTSYQLIERETADGEANLLLLAHPDIGPLDEHEVVDVFLEALGHGSGVERVMGMLWNDARLIRLERRPPQANAGGNIGHLDIMR